MAFADETYTSLFVMLQQIGIKRFQYCHSRSRDYTGRRGEQHLYHFHPVFAPQDEMFRNAPYNGIMEDPKRFVVWAYTWVSKLPIPDEEMARVILLLPRHRTRSTTIFQLVELLGWVAETTAQVIECLDLSDPHHAGIWQQELNRASSTKMHETIFLMQRMSQFVSYLGDISIHLNFQMMLHKPFDTCLKCNMLIIRGFLHRQ